ncbi:MAG TPA: leucine-rich repeat domain-containing protein [Candidatus Eubacterium faecale]|uniref:Leucine-rich repeat domain-containing protein n=1 Tax=Candidatus Eubacterium faecale TaxID=2838568 RepID=A0A9D2MJ14_9FIRM|nr:leucine-rich repeat domain-containing protein [Candidatus Eubacterium faecale]
MKKILCLILSLAMLASISVGVGLTASAESDVETGYSDYSGDFGYAVLEDGTVAIFDYTGSASELVIPSEFDGYTVTEIQGEVFEFCSSLTEVTVPDSVVSIGAWAFSSCENLTKVNIGSGVTNITSAYEVFYDCPSLQEINVDESNTAYSSQDGVLFNKDKTELLLYPADSQYTSYIIPDSVTIIGESAFVGNETLQDITIGNNVTDIKQRAFDGCTALTDITFGSGLKNIGGEAFASCTALTEVVIPEGVTEIESCFQFCTNLKNITIPASLTKIWGTPFWCCTSLEKIIVDSDNTSYCSQDGVLFNKDKTELIAYPAGDDRTAYEIPDSVTKIDMFAFYNCSNLIEITIPNSVTYIDQGAFSGCSNLKNAIIPESVTYIGVGLFEDCNSLESVIVLNPDCEIDAYREGGEFTLPENSVIYGYSGSTTQEYVDFWNNDGSSPASSYTFVPIIAADTDTEYLKNSADTVKIHCEFALADFVSVAMDGETVDPSNYTLDDGSTILTFNPAYLDTLTVGDHTVALNYTDKTATSVLTIKAVQEETTVVPDEPTTDSNEQTTSNAETENTTGLNNVIGSAVNSATNNSTKSPSTGASYAGIAAAAGAAVLSGAALIFLKKKK